MASPFETPQESVEAKAEDLEANTQKFKENAGSLRPSVNEMGKLQLHFCQFHLVLSLAIKGWK